MDTDSFIMHVKTEDFHKDIANDVERRFDKPHSGRNSHFIVENEESTFLKETSPIRYYFS